MHCEIWEELLYSAISLDRLERQDRTWKRFPFDRLQKFSTVLIVRIEILAIRMNACNCRNYIVRRKISNFGVFTLFGEVTQESKLVTPPPPPPHPLRLKWIGLNMANLHLSGFHGEIINLPPIPSNTLRLKHIPKIETVKIRIVAAVEPPSRRIY